MNNRLENYLRCTAFVLALAALASSRDFWWEFDNTDSLGLYSPHLVGLVAGGIGIVSLGAGAVLLAMPRSLGFWFIYLSVIVTFGGLNFPGRAPLSYIPFLSFTGRPLKHLLPLAGNIFTVIVLIFLHVRTHFNTNREGRPTSKFRIFARSGKKC